MQWSSLVKGKLHYVLAGANIHSPLVCLQHTHTYKDASVYKVFPKKAMKGKGFETKNLFLLDNKQKSRIHIHIIISTVQTRKPTKRKHGQLKRLHEFTKLPHTHFAWVGWDQGNIMNCRRKQNIRREAESCKL